MKAAICGWGGLLKSQPERLFDRGRNLMAVNIRFDYFNLRADKERFRRTDGQHYFGKISMEKFCNKLCDYFNSHSDDFKKNEVLIKKFKNGKKWIKWISIEKHSDFYKLLFTFNDCEVDPRIVESLQNSVLAQVVPEEHGVRSLLHIIIKTDVHSEHEANFCVQSIMGLHQNYIKGILVELFKLAFEPEFWIVKDPVEEKEINCKPYIEISAVTTSSIIEAVNKGLLREIEFFEREEVSKSFDENNVLGKKTKNISFTIDDKTSFMSKLNPNQLRGFIGDLYKKNKDDFEGAPKVFLMLKNSHNKGETRYEYSDDVTSGLTKRVYLNWEDRDINTIKSLESTKITAIPQCYDIMLEGF